MKKSLLSSIIKSRCPACREGEFFKNKNPYKLKNLGEYHDNCPNCGQRFSLEPGFYFGAAYISYGLNVALFVVVVILVNLFIEETSISSYVISIIVATLLLAPLLFRYSRIIWASMFIPLGGEKKKQL